MIREKLLHRLGHLFRFSPEPNESVLATWFRIIFKMRWYPEDITAIKIKETQNQLHVCAMGYINEFTGISTTTEEDEGLCILCQQIYKSTNTPTIKKKKKNTTTTQCL